jgi:hypothetical protein
MTGQVTYVFVGGPQRSGTSGLTRLLNTHPSVAIGNERYRLLVLDKARRDEIGPQLFEPERFFRFDPSETRIGERRYPDFDGLKRKYALATHRGDKLPIVLDIRALLLERFPRSRFVLIYRDPYKVSSSWHARQRRETDPWPAKRNYKMAVAQMNERLAQTVALARRNPRRYIPVRYERVFDPDSTTALVALLARIGLEPTPEILAAHSANAPLVRQIQAKPLLLSDEERKFIAARIDWRTFDALDALSSRAA